MFIRRTMVCGAFQIADFADHDHVRILSQKSLERSGKGQAHAWVDVDLVDAWQIDFRRVFGGGNIDVVGVEDVQAGIERHRLAGAGRPRHQNHALRLFQRLQVGRLLFQLVAQRIDA
jgi:hypothetical protein